MPFTPVYRRRHLRTLQWTIWACLWAMLWLACREQAVHIESAPLEHETVSDVEEVAFQPPSGWSEITTDSPGIRLNIKYASTDNFVEEVLYECPKCFLRTEAAEAIRRLAKNLHVKGMRVVLYDCYRPHHIQKRLWAKVPNAQYVTPPAKGSMHNRGMAIDLTIADAQGRVLDMGTSYDFFGREAHSDYAELPKQVLKNRRFLQDLMIYFNFQPIRTEWWHYSWKGTMAPIVDWAWKCD